MLCNKLWAQELVDGMPEKKYSHRALDDIRESIGELRYYRQQLWKIDDGLTEEEEERTVTSTT